MKKMSTVLSILAAVAALAALGAAVYYYLKERGEWFCCCDDEDFEDSYCDCGCCDPFECEGSAEEALSFEEETIEE